MPLFELLIKGQSTNLRAQVQLKGTDTGKIGQDGGVPVQVDASNLNYLLNGFGPLYILYVAPRQELRFLWAHDEARRLEQKQKDWKEQETITLRFHDVLDASSLNAIHLRVRQEAQMHRRALETLGRASMAEPVVIRYDPATLAGTDATKAQEQLLVGGMALVSSGLATEVMGLAALVPFPTIRHPRLQLVLAYAHYTLGRRQISLGHLAEAQLRAGELSAFDLQFLSYLKDAAEYEEGRIDLEEYSWTRQPHGKSCTGAVIL